MYRDSARIRAHLEMDKTRITHIIAPMGDYGKERWLLAFLRYIDREAFESSVVMLSASGECALAGSLDELGIKYRLVVSPRRYRKDYVDSIVEYIRDWGTHILHSHDYKSDILGYFATRHTNVKRLATPHGWCSKTDVKVACYELMDRLFLGLFDKVAPLSEAMADTLWATPRRNLAVINNFIDLGKVPEPSGSDELLITYLGRLAKLKRVEDLLHAMAFVKNRETRVQIIGDGPMRSELEAASRSLGLDGRIVFHGYRKDSLDLLNRSRILVLPSLSEGVSRAVMEGMALEKVIIGTEVPGIRELIEHGRNGFLVPTRAPRAIAGMIDYVLENPDKAGSAAREARRTVEKRFSAARIVKDYERLYNELIG